MSLPNLQIKNTGAAQTNVPFTCGHVFAAGDLLPSEGLAGLQVDVKATHPGGSVRHAILSGVITSLASGATVTMALTKAARTTPAPAVPADFSSLDSVVTIVDSGVTYSASLASLMSGAHTTFLSGDVVSEWIVGGPLKTSANASHPTISARFQVRAYKGLAKARVRVIIENCKVVNGSSTAHANYDITVTVGGAQVYAKTGLTHLCFTRFTRVFWSGTAPVAYVRHDVPYLLASKSVPNYDPALIGNLDATALANRKAAIDSNREPFANGIAAQYMPTTGGRPDIGILPGWDVAHILTMDANSADVSFSQSELMGGWEVHRRDSTTGKPVVISDLASNVGLTGPSSYAITGVTASATPVITCPNHKFKPGMMAFFLNVGGVGNINYGAYVVGAVTTNTFELANLNTTGQNYTNGGIAIPYNINQIDMAHCPAVGFLAYMLSGDHYHLEEMQFYSGFMSQGEQRTGLFDGQQLRAQAWGMRFLAHAAYLTPDDDQLKVSFTNALNANITKYNTLYSNNSSANKLGVFVGGSAWSDPDGTGVWSRVWQEDFITQSVGHLVELGFTQAAPLFNFKAKYPISRMNYCRMLASSYSLVLKPATNSPMYENIADVFTASYPQNYPQTGNDILGQVKNSAAMAAQVGPINFETIGANDMMGYPSGALGYVANMQPALAYAATHRAAGGVAAWAAYQGRVTKQDYSVNPEFAIVPRDVSTVPIEPEPEPEIPTGQNMTIAENVIETTAGTSTATLSLTGTTLGHRTFAAAVAAGHLTVGATKIPIHVQDDAGNWLNGEYTLTSATLLTRTSIGSSSTAGGDVTLAGVVRTVSLAPTDAYFKKLVSIDAAATTTVADPSTMLIPMKDAAGVVTWIPITSFIAAISTSMAQLIELTATPNTKILVSNDGTSLGYAKVSAVLALGGAAPSETISVTTPSAKVTGTAFTLAGGYTLGPPTALDYSLDGGSTWIAAQTPTIGSGAYSFSVTLSTANASQVINVRDHNNISVIGASSSFMVTGQAVQALTVATPSSKTTNVAFTVTGTYVNGTPTALDYSIDGGTNWVQIASPTIGSGNYSFSMTLTAANASQVLKVRDRTTSVTGTSGAFAVAAPVQTLAVTTPSAQVAGTAFTVAGTYANGTPTALQTSIDGGTNWVNVTSPTIGSGAYSFSFTIASANASQVLKVRDATTSTVGTSAAFVVSAPAVVPVAYLFNGPKFGPMPTTMAYTGGNYTDLSMDVIIKTAGGVAPIDADVDVYCGQSLSSSVMPRPGNNNDTFKIAGRLGAGNSEYDGVYSVGQVYHFRANGGNAPLFVWWFVFAKGADPQTATPIFAKAYDGYNSGTPIAITITG